MLRQSRLFSLVTKALRTRTSTAEKQDATSIQTALHTPLQTPLRTQWGSRLAQLPVEILLMITDDLEASHKANLIKTCRYFHYVLELTLYIHLSLGNLNTTLLHRALIEREHIIPQIRTYRLPLCPWIWTPRTNRWSNATRLFFSKKQRTYEEIESEPLENALFVFTRARNIETLQFTDDCVRDWTSEPRFEPIRQAVSNMRLKRLHLCDARDPVPVLRAQPDLEFLQIESKVHGLEKLRSTDMQKLRSLKARMEIAIQIVPGRPVEDLDLSEDYTSAGYTNEMFQRLAKSTRPIRKLCMMLDRPWLAAAAHWSLRLVSQNLKHVEELTIPVLGQLDDQGMIDGLRSFRRLRRVEFEFACLMKTVEVDESDASSSSSDISRFYANQSRHTYVRVDWGDFQTRLVEICPTLVEMKYIELLI